MEKDKDKMDSKNFRTSQDVRIIPPENRLKICFDTGKNFPFEHNTSIVRY